MSYESELQAQFKALNRTIHELQREIGRLRAIVRVNALRHGYTNEQIDDVLDPKD